MTERWHISVLIPARDEEKLISRCLRSVLEARKLLADMATCDVIVVVDNSLDSTFATSQNILGNLGVVVECNAGSVGFARAEAARVALQGCARNLSHVWLANTDADCCVPPTWLIDQLRLAQAGVQAIAGIVDVDSFEEHEAHVRERFRSTYILHEDGTHPHVHGANLGVRADAYLRAGGWANLCTAEDHDLWRRLTKTGARKLSSSHLKVVTSGRRCGRAPMGFAGALAAHNEVTLDA